jgi:hypothetical protein
MTTATLRLSTPLPAVRTAPKKGMLIRFFDAIVEARMRAAMREIEHHRHLFPEHLLKGAGYQATAGDDSALPFTR